MAVIYSSKWYDDLKEIVNGDERIVEMAPPGEWRMAIEIHGDAKSPYVPEGSDKHFFLHFDNGKLAEYEELNERHDGTGLNFRFTGPAVVFDEVAAGLTDPVEAGLKGIIKIRGDMRLLMQHAEIVSIILDLYTKHINTEWPKGKPPYST